MKNAVSRFGKFLSGMVMPNIGAFIAWGFLTALFIEAGWFPNEKLASMVSPMLTYLLPILIAGQGGKMIAGDRGRVIAAIAVVGCICGSDYTMLMGAMVMGPLAGWVIKQFDKKVEGHIPAGFEMLINNFSIGILGMLLAILGYYVQSSSSRQPSPGSPPVWTSLWRTACCRWCPSSLSLPRYCS